jgi:hypothetical protein
MTQSPERSERPAASLWRACALLEAAGTFPLRAADAVALLAYRARLEAQRDDAPDEIRSPDPFDLGPQHRSLSVCEPGSDAAAMLRLLSFGHTLR